MKSKYDNPQMRVLAIGTQLRHLFATHMGVSDVAAIKAGVLDDEFQRLCEQAAHSADVSPLMPSGISGWPVRGGVWTWHTKSDRTTIRVRSDRTDIESRIGADGSGSVGTIGLHKDGFAVVVDGALSSTAWGCAVAVGWRPTRPQQHRHVLTLAKEWGPQVEAAVRAADRAGIPIVGLLSGDANDDIMVRVKKNLLGYASRSRAAAALVAGMQP